MTKKTDPKPQLRGEAGLVQSRLTNQRNVISLSSDHQIRGICQQMALDLTIHCECSCSRPDFAPAVRSAAVVLMWLITMVSLVLVVLILATVGAPELVEEVVKNWPMP